MNKVIRCIVSRLTNTKTLIAIASAVILIIQTMGYNIDNQKAMVVVNAICTIGILIGVLNNRGMTQIKWNQ